MLSIVKRNGEKQAFDAQKIVKAIEAAFKDVEHEVSNSAHQLAVSIATIIAQIPDTLSVEQIQDRVEDLLMSSHRKDVAKAYIQWRYKRSLIRRENTTDKTLMEMLIGKNDYWNDENSNKNAKVVHTQRDYIAGICSTDLTRRLLLPEDIVKAHDEGLIHFHDADYYAQNVLHNCCLINLNDMLQNGTCINGVWIDKPHRLITATTIATQIITAVSSSQYGGCTISLSHLAPFIDESRQRYRGRFEKIISNKDELDVLVEEATNREIVDSVQTFNYQVNSMSTTNGQAPFLSVCMYLNEVPEGQVKEDLAKLIEAFLDQRILGFKNDKGVYITPAFPKLLYFLEEDNIRPGTKYWYLTELAAKCTAKRMVPDYISEKMMIELKKGEVYPCMGCRSFLTPDRTTKNYAKALDYDPVKSVGHKYYGRFNQGVVTINLVDVALSAKQEYEHKHNDEHVKTTLDDEFWRILRERLELCHKALRMRHDRLCNGVSDMAPVLWQHGALARLEKGESIRELLYHGYSTISLGYAGLYECVKVITGESQSGKIGKEFGLQVMKFMNSRALEWKQAEDIDYSVYGTPIESTTYKFALALKKRFGEDVFVKMDGRDRNYITNSYHIPVFEEIDPFTKLSLESEFQALSPGGAISYIECADLTKNTEVVEQVIQFIYDHIMYAELNTKSDYCGACGFDGEIEIVDCNNRLEWRCPNCGNMDKKNLWITRRTCGYLGKNYFNQGRTNEIRDRYVHLDDHEAKD